MLARSLGGARAGTGCGWAPATASAARRAAATILAGGAAAFVARPARAARTAVAALLVAALAGVGRRVGRDHRAGIPAFDGLLFDRLLDQALDGAQQLDLGLVHQRQRRAGAARPARAPDAVHVIL